MSLGPVAPVRGLSIADQVYQQLRDAIVRMEFKPNQPIKLPELEQRMGVSRTPLRQALKHLEREGLVLAYPQRGTYVAPLRAEDIQAAADVRLYLELGNFRAVAPRVGPAVLDDLAAALARMQAACGRDITAFLEADDAFHDRLLAESRNGMLVAMVHQARAHLDRVRAWSLNQVAQYERVCRQHEALLAALRQGDITAALDTLEQHLTETHRFVVAQAAAVPEYFAGR